MKLKKTLLILGAFGIAAAGANPALAANHLDKPNERTYPGSMCQPREGEQEGDVKRVSNGSHHDSEIGEPDYSHITMVCPIIKNIEGSEKAVKVYARIHSDNASLTSCWVVSFNWDHSKSIPGSSNHVKGFNVREGVDVIGPPTTFAGGTLQMLCGVPKGSTILNYHVIE